MLPRAGKCYFDEREDPRYEDATYPCNREAPEPWAETKAHTAYEADRGKVAGGADEPTGRSKPALTVGQSALRATTVRKNVTLSAP